MFEEHIIKMHFYIKNTKICIFQTGIHELYNISQSEIVFQIYLIVSLTSVSGFLQA